jgi:hypothetical protein
MADDRKDKPVLIKETKSALDALAVQLQRTEGLTKAQAYEAAKKRLAPDVAYYADPEGFIYTGEEVAEQEAAKEARERGVPTADEPTVLERNTEEATERLRVALDETRGDLGQAIRRGLVTEQEAEQAASTGAVKVQDDEGPRSLTPEDIRQAGLSEGVRVIEEQRAARIAQTLRDITPARYDDGAYNLERALEYASAEELEEAGFSREALDRATLRREAAQEVSAGEEDFLGRVRAPLQTPRPLSPSDTPSPDSLESGLADGVEEPPVTAQTAARLAQYGRTEEARALTERLAQDYQAARDPEAWENLKVDVVPLYWLTKRDRLSNTDQALYAASDALFFLSPFIARGAVAVARGARAAGASVAQVRAGRALEAVRASYIATGRSAAQADEMFDAIQAVRAAQRASLEPGGSPARVVEALRRLKNLAAAQSNYRMQQWAVNLESDVLREGTSAYSPVWRKILQDQRGSLRLGGPDAEELLVRYADEAARSAPRLDSRSLAALNRARQLEMEALRARGAAAQAAEARPALSSALVRGSSEAISTLSNEIAAREEELERALIATEGLETARIRTLQTELADLRAERERVGVEEGVDLERPQIVTLATPEPLPLIEVERPRASVREPAPAEVTSIQEQVQADLEAAREPFISPEGVPTTSIQEQVQADLEAAREPSISPEGVPTTSIQEQVQADLEAAREPSISPEGVPTTSIQEQVQADLEASGFSREGTSLQEQVQADMEGRSDPFGAPVPVTRLAPAPQARVVPEPFPDPLASPEPAPEPESKPVPRPEPAPTPKVTVDPRMVYRSPRAPRMPLRGKDEAPSEREPRPQMAEWVGHRQGFVYRYKNLRTGREVASLKPLYGKVPPESGKGSATRSARIVRTSTEKGSARTDKMGAFDVRYTADGRISFKKNKKRKQG